MSKYYVYAHFIEGEVVYIGKGCGARAFHPRPHCQHLADRADFSYVKFLATDLIEESSLTIEKALIEQYKPRFNKTYNTDNHKPIKASPFSTLTKEEKLEFFRECGRKGGRPRKT